MDRNGTDVALVADTLNEILERLPDAILVADDEGHYFANSAACALLRRNRAEIEQLSVADVANSGFDVDVAWRGFREISRAGGELELRCGDGTILPIEFNASTNVLPGRHVSVLRDISDRKRLEGRLRQSEERFMTAFIANPLPLTIRVLSTGVYVEANEAFSRLTGTYRANVIGTTAERSGAWVDTAPEDALLERLRASNDREMLQARLIARTSGHEVDVAARRVEMHGEPHVVTAYTDITALQIS